MIINNVKSWREAITLIRKYPEYHFSMKGNKGDYTLKGVER